MPGLNLDNILIDEESGQSPFATSVIDPTVIQDTPNDSIVDINPDNLFGDSATIDTPNPNVDNVLTDSKPIDSNTFSIFGAALVEEGILTSSTEEELAKISSGEELLAVIDKEISSRLDERQRRIDEALNVGVPTPIIKEYESVINYLDTINDDVVSKETEEGEALRKQLITEDYLNKGFSKERAERETRKSLESGNDIEDAKEALIEVRKHYKSLYTNTVEEGKKVVNANKQKEIDSAKKVEDMIIKEKELFPGLVLAQDVRQKIADTAYKAVYTDSNGNKFSALQKFQKENPEEFLAKVSTIFTLTDGFKDFSKLVDTHVKKVTSAKLKDLDNKLRGMGGNDVSLRNSPGDDNLIKTRTGNFIIDN